MISVSHCHCCLLFDHRLFFTGAKKHQPSKTLVSVALVRTAWIPKPLLAMDSKLILSGWMVKKGAGFFEVREKAESNEVKSGLPPLRALSSWG
jgi:hypothetical protein